MYIFVGPVYPEPLLPKTTVLLKSIVPPSVTRITLPVPASENHAGPLTAKAPPLTSSLLKALVASANQFQGTFFSWNHSFETLGELDPCSDHVVEELPPRYDFF